MVSVSPDVDREGTTVSWSPVDGAASYYLTVGTSPGAGDVVNASLPASQTSLPVSLPPGRTLYATLWVYPVAGGGATASDITFTTNSGVGLTLTVDVKALVRGSALHSSAVAARFRVARLQLFNRTSRARSVAVWRRPLAAQDTNGQFAQHAGKAFGTFHHLIDQAFKAGKLNPTHLDKKAASDATAAAALVAQEAKLAKQAAAQDAHLAPLAATLQRIADTVALIPPDLNSDIPSTKSVELAAIQYIDTRISEIETAAQQAGQPITETNG